jgi:hypothetical protein
MHRTRKWGCEGLVSCVIKVAENTVGLTGQLRACACACGRAGADKRRLELVAAAVLIPGSDC